MWWLAIGAALFLASKFFPNQVGKVAAVVSTRFSPYLGYGHSICVAASAVYVVPLEVFGLGEIKYIAWLAALWGHAIASGRMLLKNYPPPAFPTNLMAGFSIKNWKESMQKFQVAMAHMAPYFQGDGSPTNRGLMGSVDFHYLFLVLIFLSASPMVLVVGLLGRRSLWTMCTDAKKNSSDSKLWRMASPKWEASQASGRTNDIVQKCNLVEIILGFYLAISLFLPQRQIFACILYWQFLVIRYQAGKHHEAWRFINGKAQPLLKAIPFLQKPVDMAKGFFNPQPR